MNRDTLNILQYDLIKELVSKYATSALGKKTVAQLKPSIRHDDILRWLSETSEMVSLIRSGIPVPLGGIHDIDPLLKRSVTHKTPLEPEHLLEIFDTLRASETIKDFCEGLSPEYSHIAVIGAEIGYHRELCSEISRCIDDHGNVKDEASPKLASIRAGIGSLKKRMEKAVSGFVNSREYSLYIQSQDISIRNNRYVIPVKSQYQNKIQGIHHGHSHSGATVYIEPQELVTYGNELETLLFQERSEVTEILWNLTSVILGDRASIAKTLEQLGWLDCTYAKARYSIAYSMTQPVLSPDGITNLRKARHPILLYLPEPDIPVSGTINKETFNKVIPVDVRLGDDFDMLVITGPNTGGKTVTLKTLGLLSLMTQSGLHIPVEEGSTIPVYRGVYADIGDEQSIEQSLSTFSSHIKRIITILKRCGPKTLVLLDELGAGTDPVEGAALGTAILQFLDSKHAKAAITTHLGQLKVFAYSSERTENACVEFNPTTFMPTYRLLIGQPGRSNALIIAERLGMHETVLQNARQTISDKPSRMDDAIDKIQQVRYKVEENRRITESRLKEVTEQKSLYDKKYDEVSFREAQLNREKELELFRSIDALKSQFLDLMEPARKNNANLDRITREMLEQFRIMKESTSIGKKRKEFLKKLAVGDTVFLNRFNEVGVIKSIDKSKSGVTVKVLDKLVKTTFEEISWVDFRNGWR